MKKFFISMSMLLSVATFAMAENNNVESTNNVEAYQFNINTNSLSRALELSKDQSEMSIDIMSEFERCMSFASEMPTDERKKTIVKNTVANNIKYMSSILTKSQFGKYLRILNTTLNNRGINY